MLARFRLQTFGCMKELRFKYVKSLTIGVLPLGQSLKKLVLELDYPKEPCGD